MTNPARLPMTSRSLRNLFSRPATRRYPQTVRPPFDGARGRLELDADACNLCSLCARRCPTEALRVAPDESRFELDDLRCIACGVCVDVCTSNALRLTTATPLVYAASPAGAGSPTEPGSPTEHASPALGHREWTVWVPPEEEDAPESDSALPSAVPGSGPPAGMPSRTQT